jgi:hypothetical protein
MTLVTDMTASISLAQMRIDMVLSPVVWQIPLRNHAGTAMGGFAVSTSNNDVIIIIYLCNYNIGCPRIVYTHYQQQRFGNQLNRSKLNIKDSGISNRSKLSIVEEAVTCAFEVHKKIAADCFDQLCFVHKEIVSLSIT